MVRFDDILEKATPYLTDKDIFVLQKAYVFAGRAHKGQTRRSGEPYLSHPLEVAYFLAGMRLDRTTLVAALLHDALEDTELTPAEIRESFGREVAALVEGVTKISQVHGASPESDRAETVRKIILAMTDDIRVIFIKLADRIHNLKTLKYLEPGQRERIARETLDIYAPIANRLGMGRIRAELEDLAFQYVAPAEYQRIERLLAPIKRAAEKDLAAMRAELEALLRENGVPGEVHARVKRPYSIWTKMQRRGIDFDQVFDLLALRIVTDSVKNCYAVLGIIHQRWSHLPQRFRDFIAMPKPNLYQALHTTVITEKEKKFEIQVRTREMDDLAENGIAAHWRYKEGGPPESMREDRRLHWLREMVTLYEEQRNPKEFLKTLKANLVPEELYVFTPKGKVVTLPPGATALDFAFKIHTEVGLHAAGALINGQAAPLKTGLKTGDIVEILTADEAVPTRAWLAAAATSGARQHIKKWLNLRSRAKAVELGRKLWEKEFSRVEAPADLADDRKLLARVEEVLGVRLHDMEEFYRQVGLGRIVVTRTLIEGLARGEALAARDRSFLEKAVAFLARRPGAGIVIKSLEDPMMKLAKCCSPIKGEPVVGYITAGKGITVHAARCPFVVKELLDSQRLVEVGWNASLTGTFDAGLSVVAEDSPGVLAAVAAAVADLGGNIIKAEARSLTGGKAQIKLGVRVRDLAHLEEILGRVRGVKQVFEVVRS